MELRTSESVKNQEDYNIMIEHINKMINKENTNPPSGSIILGIRYANDYLNEITKMLETEYVDMIILNELSKKVVKDLEFIRADCKKRFSTQNTMDNNIMMGIILDFILTLHGD